jgi:ornithine cyclodeaminase/alanine dehydrogenase-like protein (mu-crystallin family)
VVLADWLEPGMHVGAISPRQTDEANFFPRVDRWVAHHRLTTQQFSSASQAHGRSPAGPPGAEREPVEVATLADLLCRRATGRTSPEQITYFGGRQIAGAANDSFGSSGTGVQFSALGYDIYQRAKATGVGQEIPTDWFFESLHP